MQYIWWDEGRGSGVREDYRGGMRKKCQFLIK